jgi:hypothetical protein
VTQGGGPATQNGKAVVKWNAVKVPRGVQCGPRWLWRVYSGPPDSLRWCQLEPPSPVHLYSLAGKVELLEHCFL